MSAMAVVLPLPLAHPGARAYPILCFVFSLLTRHANHPVADDSLEEGLEKRRVDLGHRDRGGGSRRRVDPGKHHDLGQEDGPHQVANPRAGPVLEQTPVYEKLRRVSVVSTCRSVFFFFQQTSKKLRNTYTGRVYILIICMYDYLTAVFEVYTMIKIQPQKTICVERTINHLFCVEV